MAFMSETIILLLPQSGHLSGGDGSMCSHRPADHEAWPVMMEGYVTVMAKASQY